MNRLPLVFIVILMLVLTACTMRPEHASKSERCAGLARQMTVEQNQNRYGDARFLQRRRIMALQKQYDELGCHS